MSRLLLLNVCADHPSLVASRRVIGGCALLALCWVGRASSTTVVEGSLFEDLELAESVLTATITDIWVAQDVRGIPQTTYGLGDVDPIKGDPPLPLEIRIDGGTLDSGLALEVIGVPKFSEGDRVLLFLRSDNPVCPIIGFKVRSFRILERGDGQDIVTTYDGLPVLGLNAESRISAAASETDQGLTLEEFRGLLEEMMARPDYKDSSQ